MATQDRTIPRNRRRWLRRLVLAFGALLVVLIAGFFLLTNPGFVKRFVLPRVGSALQADIQVDDLEWRPLSRLVLKDFEVTPYQRQRFLSAETVVVHCASRCEQSPAAVASRAIGPPHLQPQTSRFLPAARAPRRMFGQ